MTTTKAVLSPDSAQRMLGHAIHHTTEQTHDGGALEGRGGAEMSGEMGAGPLAQNLITPLGNLMGIHRGIPFFSRPRKLTAPLSHRET